MKREWAVLVRFYHEAETSKEAGEFVRHAVCANGAVDGTAVISVMMTDPPKQAYKQAL